MAAERGDGDDDDDRPPFFASWRGMYALVLITLAALIALFTAVSVLYR